MKKVHLNWTSQPADAEVPVEMIEQLAVDNAPCVIHMQLLKADLFAVRSELRALPSMRFNSRWYEDGSFIDGAGLLKIWHQPENIDTIK
jgi:hypothetical protein